MTAFQDIHRLVQVGPKLSSEYDLSSFINYYDNIFALPMADAVKNLTVVVVKTLITGRCRFIIDSNPQATTWNDIKELLINNLCDSRSLNQLTDKLLTLRNSGSVLDFYYKIQDLRSKINFKFKADNPTATQEQIVNYAESIERIALEQFKEKIDEPLKSILISRNPGDLPKALSILKNTPYDIHTKNFGNDRQFYRQNNQNYRNKNNFYNSRYQNNRQNYNKFPNNNFSNNNNFPNNNFPNNNNFSNQHNNSFNNNNFNQHQKYGQFNPNQNNFNQFNQNAFNQNPFNQQNISRNSNQSRLRKFGVPQPMQVDSDTLGNFRNNPYEHRNFRLTASDPQYQNCPISSHQPQADHYDF